MENFEYTLRPYTTKDYEFVFNTKKTAYKKYVEEIWGEWNDEKQREMFRDFINTYGKNIYIVILNGQEIGFYHGDIIENGGYEIGNICIVPKFQGRGIGTKILTDVIDKNKDKDIYLRYFKQNPVARLYERLGFQLIEEMPYHFKMVLKKRVY